MLNESREVSHNGRSGWMGTLRRSVLGEGESFGEPVARAKSDKISDFLSNTVVENEFENVSENV
jgi:hypothetical protein